MSVGAKIVNAVFCDDARKELSGKSILIGVYDDTIMTQTFPINLKLCMWFSFQVLRIGEISIEIRVRSLRKKDMGSGNLQIIADEENVNRISSFAMNMENTIEGDETFFMDFKIDNGRWKNFRQLNISAREPDQGT